jgi:predicted nucleic acid-binding protein
MPAGKRCATRSIVIAVDTNILVYAHRTDSPFHERARLTLESLAMGARAWAIP